MIGQLEVPLASQRPHVLGAKRKSEKWDLEPNERKKKVQTLEPIAGNRPIVTMTLQHHNPSQNHHSYGRSHSHNQRIQVLLDPGASIPVISRTLVQHLQIPTIKRTIPRNLQAFDAQTTSLSEYTHDLVLQHENHYTKLACEISLLEEECDLILPHWWLQQHPPSSFFAKNPADIRFDSERCQLDCTRIKMTQDRPVVAGIQETEQALARVPERFRAHLPIMSEEAADRLPDHRPWDHTIDLVEGSTPPWGPLYPMSEKELRFLKPWIANLLATGKIRPGKAPCAAPLFMVNKLPSLEHEGKRSEEDLRPVIDYRGINKITIPNKYPLPLAQELQDRLANARYFTKIDLKSGFHLVRMKKGEEWKTSFRCRYGLFEWTVMPMGLLNSPAAFQAMLNGIFADLLDLGVLCYMDDILAFAETLEEHDRIVLEVLKRLQENNLAVNPTKCTWATTEVNYLGYVINEHGVSMSSEKVECIIQWKSPKTLKEVQRFLGFANFYRRFIHAFSRIAKPLTDSTKADAKQWKWTAQMEEAFRELKNAFTQAPVLIHFHPGRIIFIECDASDFAISGILSQKGDDGKLHPVAFHSRKMLPTEVNYEIHDKELLAIVDCFTRWRRYLEGAQERIEVFSDHENLMYFQKAKVLNRRQARWTQQLSTYNFIINFRPGAQNTKADILSRREEYRPEKGGDEDQPVKSVLQQKHFATPVTSVPVTSVAQTGSDLPASSFMLSSLRLCSIPTPEWNAAFIDRVKEAAKDDQEYQRQLVTPGKDTVVQQQVLYKKNRLWIPRNEDLCKAIMNSEHDTKVAGHMGMDKTIELIRRNMWWPDLEKDVSEYVTGCRECQQNKPRRHRPFGLLQPMEIHYCPWQTVAMDFITDLPLSNGCTSIWVMIDPFTKMAHFVPLKENAKKSDDLVKIFAREYWRLHGIPRDIISDRDSRFTSALWSHFLKYVGVKPRMSTAFHPQTDGQTERMNQFIEAYLRAFTNYEMTNWEDLLATAEFAYNNARSTATHTTPFYANYGYHPVAANPPDPSARNPTSELYAHWMTRVYKDAGRMLQQTQARMKKYADRKREEAPTFTRDQLVMLDARNIKTRRPAKKLDKKFLGPFKIQRILSPTAVKLTLPKKWRIHNSFHVSLIEPYRTGSQNTPDPAYILQTVGDVEPEEYTIDDIKDSAHFEGNVKYLVKWEGWPLKKDWTWEPFEHFSDPSVLISFHQRHPQKPRDRRVIEQPT